MPQLTFLDLDVRLPNMDGDGFPIPFKSLQTFKMRGPVVQFANIVNCFQILVSTILEFIVRVEHGQPNLWKFTEDIAKALNHSWLSDPLAHPPSSPAAPTAMAQSIHAVELIDTGHQKIVYAWFESSPTWSLHLRQPCLTLAFEGSDPFEGYYWSGMTPVTVEHPFIPIITHLPLEKVNTLEIRQTYHVRQKEVYLALSGMPALRHLLIHEYAGLASFLSVLGQDINLYIDPSSRATASVTRFSNLNSLAISSVNYNERRFNIEDTFYHIFRLRRGLNKGLMHLKLLECKNLPKSTVRKWEEVVPSIYWDMDGLEGAQSKENM
ncbi:hypothetical protein FA15DRAFT_706345 [Coprinopsis marcescibilis]|uniref:Uncharacterized protein n=1 Tax=Coprinopsis marcescibilis TaxID=230819 RepID=A0A5C3KQ62_COPMA|nr:hypothetical protein FA15DRAFT_706345 [Coprinopsis marcescibilis]